MPKQIEFPERLERKTFRTLRDAFEKAADDQRAIVETGAPGLTNITSILTRIIQESGRFAESYASDALYGMDDLRLLAESEYPLPRDIDEIICFGIRRRGVDHNEFIMARLMDTKDHVFGYVYPDRIYRKILAVHVSVKASRSPDGNPTERPVLTMELRDVTDRITKIDPADLDADGHVKRTPLDIQPEKGGDPNA